MKNDPLKKFIKALQIYLDEGLNDKLYDEILNEKLIDAGFLDEGETLYLILDFAERDFDQILNPELRNIKRVFIDTKFWKSEFPKIYPEYTHIPTSNFDEDLISSYASIGFGEVNGFEWKNGNLGLVTYIDDLIEKLKCTKDLTEINFKELFTCDTLRAYIRNLMLSDLQFKYFLSPSVWKFSENLSLIRLESETSKTSNLKLMMKVNNYLKRTKLFDYGIIDLQFEFFCDLDSISNEDHDIWLHIQDEWKMIQLLPLDFESSDIEGFKYKTNLSFFDSRSNINEPIRIKINGEKIINDNRKDRKIIYDIAYRRPIALTIQTSKGKYYFQFELDLNY